MQTKDIKVGETYAFDYSTRSRRYYGRSSALQPVRVTGVERIASRNYVKVVFLDPKTLTSARNDEWKYQPANIVAQWDAWLDEQAEKKARSQKAAERTRIEEATRQERLNRINEQLKARGLDQLHSRYDYSVSSRFEVSIDFIEALLASSN